MISFFFIYLRKRGKISLPNESFVVIKEVYVSIQIFKFADISG